MLSISLSSAFFLDAVYGFIVLFAIFLTVLICFTTASTDVNFFISTFFSVPALVISASTRLLPSPTTAMLFLLLPVGVFYGKDGSSIWLFSFFKSSIWLKTSSATLPNLSPKYGSSVLARSSPKYSSLGIGLSSIFCSS